MLKFKTNAGDSVSSASSSTLSPSDTLAKSEASPYRPSQSKDNTAYETNSSTRSHDSIGVRGLRRRETAKNAASFNRKSSFISSESGFSKASVIFKNVSLPLAWPTDEYFGTRKECREFTVQLLFRTAEGHEIFSHIQENVTRAVTDVNFNEFFIFPFQSPDFYIEVIVYCKRTDENANTNFMQSLSRSLGRSFGQSLKNYLKSGNSTISVGSRHYNNGDELANVVSKSRRASKNFNDLNVNYFENYRNPDKMCALGRAKFRLRNASLSGRIHTYSLEILSQEFSGYSRSQLLPIYGSICAQIFVQPSSLSSPLAEGILDVLVIKTSQIQEKLFCVLQGAQLKCFSKSSINDKNDNDTQRPLFTIPINQECTIEITAFPLTIRVKFAESILFDESAAKATSSVLLVAESRSAYLGWRNALALQIADCTVWADFASATRNPHAYALRFAEFEIDNSSSELIDALNAVAETNAQRAKNNRQRAPIPILKKTSTNNVLLTNEENPQKSICKEEVSPKSTKNKLQIFTKIEDSTTIVSRYDSPDSAISTKHNSEFDNNSDSLNDEIDNQNLEKKLENITLNINPKKKVQIDESKLNKIIKKERKIDSVKNNKAVPIMNQKPISMLQQKQINKRENVYSNELKDESGNFVISLQIGRDDVDEDYSPNYKCLSYIKETDYRVQDNLSQASTPHMENYGDKYGSINHTCSRMEIRTSPKFANYNKAINKSLVSGVKKRSTIYVKADSPQWTQTAYSQAASNFSTFSHDLTSLSPDSGTSSSSSISSSNHETQTARTEFIGQSTTSKSSALSLTSPSRCIDASMPYSTELYTSNIPHIPTARRLLLQTKKNFAENRQKFENHCNSKHPDYNDHQKFNGLKKSSSLSFANPLCYIEKSSPSSIIHNEDPILGRGDRWNTITSTGTFCREDFIVLRDTLRTKLQMLQMLVNHNNRASTVSYDGVARTRNTVFPVINIEREYNPTISSYSTRL